MFNGASFKYKMKHWVLPGVTYFRKEERERINLYKVKALVLQITAPNFNLGLTFINNISFAPLKYGGLISSNYGHLQDHEPTDLKCRGASCIPGKVPWVLPPYQGWIYPFTHPQAGVPWGQDLVLCSWSMPWAQRALSKLVSEHNFIFHLLQMVKSEQFYTKSDVSLITGLKANKQLREAVGFPERSEKHTLELGWKSQEVVVLGLLSSTTRWTRPGRSRSWDSLVLGPQRPNPHPLIVLSHILHGVYQLLKLRGSLSMSRTLSPPV